MEIRIFSESVESLKTDLLVIPLFKGDSVRNLEANRGLEGALESLAENDRFEAGSGEWLVTASLGRLKSRKIALVGLGERKKFDEDAYRKFGASIVKRAKDLKAKRVIVQGLPQAGEIGPRPAMQALSEGMLLAEYGFHAYHKKNRDKAKREALLSIDLHEPSRARASAMERGLSDAKTLARGVELARDLVNTPSADMPPARLAEAAREVAKGKRVSLKILEPSQMEKMGMGAALAVARGSDHPPVGVHLVYRPAGKPKKKIAIVGKAVTFDSGGLSIKPSDGMMTMKIDMGGAASVLGLFAVLPELALNVEVHGIFLAVENMPSGKAYRPGDVVTAMDGTTIEVLNTDAEGRVTLADALAYAVKQKPDAIIDLATLTGACVVALGEEVAGLLSNDRKLADRLLRAANEAGEALWELPLIPSYRELIKSKIADLKNIGGRAGGTITAALFLEPFVKGTSWAHLDIAGPVYTERETRPDFPYGATGYGVRLLAKYLQSL